MVAAAPRGGRQATARTPSARKAASPARRDSRRAHPGERKGCQWFGKQPANCTSSETKARHVEKGGQRAREGACARATERASERPCEMLPAGETAVAEGVPGLTAPDSSLAQAGAGRRHSVSVLSSRRSSFSAPSPTSGLRVSFSPPAGSPSPREEFLRKYQAVRGLRTGAERRYSDGAIHRMPILAPPPLPQSLEPVAATASAGTLVSLSLSLSLSLCLSVCLSLCLRLRRREARSV